MSVHREFHLEEARRELDAAQEQLAVTVDTTPDDDTTAEQVVAATDRLRLAQARHAAAKSGVLHLADLIRWG